MAGTGKLSRFPVENPRRIWIVEHQQQQLAAEQMEQLWQRDPRWRGICRTYTAKDVVRLRGTVPIEYSLARLGAERLWRLFETEPYVHALGALTGNMAVQQVQAGLKAIYLSGW